MASLTEERKGWEKGCTVVSETPIVIEGFKKLLVIIKTKDDKYNLNRYWESGMGSGEWSVSVDLHHETLQKCLDRLKEDKDLKEMIASLSS